jgi:hypothetical protein
MPPLWRWFVIAIAVVMAAMLYFVPDLIVREGNVEERLGPVKEAGPCRAARHRALEAHKGYRDQVRAAVQNRECVAQGTLNHWAYCVAHELFGPGECPGLPSWLRPDRSQDDGDRRGGDADQSPPNEGNGLGGGLAPPATGIHTPAPGGPHAPSAPSPGPVDSVVDALEDALPPLCGVAPDACDVLP